MITLTLPVHNEEEMLEEKLHTVDTYLQATEYGRTVQIVIADNASSDKTGLLSKELVARTVTKAVYFFTDIEGKGNAIRASWQRFPAQQYWFMDLDLSTDLAHMDELYSGLQNHDIVIGSRLLLESKTTRCAKREITSRGYNFLLRSIFDKEFSDAQCGFKGASEKAVNELLPLTRHNGYFFDTELLLLAERNGYSIAEIPVHWTENRTSKVRLHKTIPYFLQAMSQHYLRTKREPYSLCTTSILS